MILFNLTYLHIHTSQKLRVENPEIEHIDVNSRIPIINVSIFSSKLAKLDVTSLRDRSKLFCVT